MPFFWDGQLPNKPAKKVGEPCETYCVFFVRLGTGIQNTEIARNPKMICVHLNISK